MNTTELEQLENQLESALRNIRSTKVTLEQFQLQLSIFSKAMLTFHHSQSVCTSQLSILSAKGGFGDMCISKVYGLINLLNFLTRAT